LCSNPFVDKSTQIELLTQIKISIILSSLSLLKYLRITLSAH
jgi:hypothetical protein